MVSPSRATLKGANKMKLFFQILRHKIVQNRMLTLAAILIVTVTSVLYTFSSTLSNFNSTLILDKNNKRKRSKSNHYNPSDVQTKAQKDEDYLISQLDKSCKNNDKDDDDFKLANLQSFGFFKDIPCKSWNRMRQITTKNEMHAYPEQPLYRVNIPHSWYQMNYEPNFACMFEQRIGGNGNGDGPKVRLLL